MSRAKTQKTTTETSAVTRMSNREFNDAWERENEREGRYVSPDVLAGERSRELRGTPLPAPLDPSPTIPGLPVGPDFATADRYVLAGLPQIMTRHGILTTPGNADTESLLAEIKDRSMQIRDTDRARFEDGTLVPADLPAETLVSTTDALLRWGACAANLAARNGNQSTGLNNLAAEVASAILAGPEQVYADLRTVCRRIAATSESGASFSLRWKRDRLAIALLAYDPQTKANPATHFPFTSWEPNWKPSGNKTNNLLG